MRDICGRTDVLILCGGLGTRLSAIVNDRPKPMAEVNGKPFMDILIEFLSIFGFKKFILLSGHKSDVIERYYGSRKQGIEIIVSKETAPLGTAGAIKNAEHLVRSSDFLCLNGDSFCDFDASGLLSFHKEKSALATVLLSEAGDSRDYGLADMDGEGRVTGFSEKKGSGAGLVNAGAYVFRTEIMDFILKDVKSSLEEDLFRDIMKRGMGFYGYKAQGELFDIGTPAKLHRAIRYLSKETIA